MGESLQDALAAFRAANGFNGKGPLSIALTVTQQARKQLPIDAADLITAGGGQVKGTGGSAIQRVLEKHGIQRKLAKEGGRTSRGSIKKMQAYVAFLNDRHAKDALDIDLVEKFWIARVHDYFASKPFSIKLDASRSLRAMIADILAQAEARQKTSPGVHYAGAVLQHIVGAQLDCALGTGRFTHNSFSTADAPAARKGDFLIGQAAIHVTTSPSEALLDKCIDNINDGYRPIIVTTRRGMPLAEGLAQNKNIAERLDVFEVEQFVTLNLYQLGKFAGEGWRAAITEFVERYNQIIDDVETDPSLKIELKD